MQNQNLVLFGAKWRGGLENKYCAYLKEKEGYWYARRIAGSFGEFDVIAFHDDHTLAVQLKRWTHAYKDELEAFKQIRVPPGVITRFVRWRLEGNKGVYHTEWAYDGKM